MLEEGVDASVTGSSVVNQGGLVTNGAASGDSNSGGDQQDQTGANAFSNDGQPKTLKKPVHTNPKRTATSKRTSVILPQNFKTMNLSSFATNKGNNDDVTAPTTAPTTTTTTGSLGNNDVDVVSIDKVNKSDGEHAIPPNALEIPGLKEDPREGDGELGAKTLALGYKVEDVGETLTAPQSSLSAHLEQREHKQPLGDQQSHSDAIQTQGYSRRGAMDRLGLEDSKCSRSVEAGQLGFLVGTFSDFQNLASGIKPTAEILKSHGLDKDIQELQELASEDPSRLDMYEGFTGSCLQGNRQLWASWVILSKMQYLYECQNGNKNEREWRRAEESRRLNMLHEDYKQLGERYRNYTESQYDRLIQEKDEQIISLKERVALQKESALLQSQVISSLTEKIQGLESMLQAHLSSDCSSSGNGSIGTNSNSNRHGGTKKKTRVVTDGEKIARLARLQKNLEWTK